jgi:hypothetical protein
MLAHAGGIPEFLATIFAAIGFVTAWMGQSRLRHRGFLGMPKPVAFVLLGVAPIALVASIVVPPRFAPQIAAGPRPRSTATISFAEPAAGQVVHGDDLPVRIDLTGGRIVQQTTTNITPDTGHLHLYLDGSLVSMAYGTSQDVPVGDLTPGVHRLLAEYVAADHAPFDPRVTATVSFVKASA